MVLMTRVSGDREGASAGLGMHAYLVAVTWRGDLPAHHSWVVLWRHDAHEWDHEAEEEVQGCPVLLANSPQDAVRFGEDGPLC